MIRPSQQAVQAAVEALKQPIRFGTGQGEAAALLGKMTPIVCYKCTGAGTVPGKRKLRKCRKCGGGGTGYSYAGAVYWTGQPTRTASATEAMA